MKQYANEKGKKKDDESFSALTVLKWGTSCRVHLLPVVTNTEILISVIF